MQELLNKEHNIGSLESFYNVNQKQMDLMHHSFLLYRVNQVYKEIKRRSANPEAAAAEEQATGPQLEPLNVAQQVASSIYKQVCFHINRHVKDLEGQALHTVLSTVSQGTDVDKSELSQAALEEIEKKVLDDLPRFMNLDIASIIGSFLKLHYVPRMILHEINQQQSLSTFNKYSCMIILENLVSEGYDESSELYDKFFAQLRKSSANLNTKLVNRTLSILHKYQEIFKGAAGKAEQVQELTQFYVDRFNDSVKIVEKQVETEIVLSSLEMVRAVHKSLRDAGNPGLELELFIDNCLRLLEDRIEKLRPEVFLRSIENFEEAKLRQRYVSSILKAMRENKFDVRRFNFVQLSKLVQLVAQYQKADLHVFFRYVLSCVEQDFYP